MEAGPGAGDRFPEQDGKQAEPDGGMAGASRRKGGVGLEPGYVEGDSSRGVGGGDLDVSRRGDLPGARAADHPRDTMGRGSEEARGAGRGLSPEMGGGPAERTDAGGEESGRQAGRAVIDAGALATARAQLAAGKERIERPGKVLAAAALRLERQAEQEARRLEKEKKLQKKLEAELERKRERGAERELDPFD